MIIENMFSSQEYVNSLRERFPELSAASQEDIFTALQKNEDRSDRSLYTSQRETALQEIDQEIYFDDRDDELVDYFLTQSTEKITNLFRSAINHVIKEGKSTDFVLGFWEKERPKGWTETI